MEKVFRRETGLSIVPNRLNNLIDDDHLIYILRMSSFTIKKMGRGHSIQRVEMGVLRTRAYDPKSRSYIIGTKTFTHVPTAQPIRARRKDEGRPVGGL